MSEIIELVAIEPPVGLSYIGARTEHMHSKIYRCTVCNGSGGKCIDSRSYGYDSSKGESYHEACKMCKGTGQIQATITQEWIAVGEVKEQFK